MATPGYALWLHARRADALPLACRCTLRYLALREAHLRFAQSLAGNYSLKIRVRETARSVRMEVG